MKQSSSPYIEVNDLVIGYGGLTAVDHVSFQAEAGDHLTLLGPSGCGKTTILRAFAGLETPISGEIRIGGDVIYSSSRGINVPIEDRGLAMVFQSYAIWPHMTVSANVGYGLKLRGLPAAARKDAITEALELVGLQDYADRGAAALSGGQQQRVALARALVVKPKLLLLDEPLSNLDARLRAKMRVEIQELKEKYGVSCVYVTHDQEEALALSDQIIVLNKGRISQSGTPDEIYNRPSNAFVADFVGAANLLRGRSMPTTTSEQIRFTVGSTPLSANSLGRSAQTDEVTCAIRPHQIMLVRERGNYENALDVNVRQRSFLGDTVEYVLDAENAQLVAKRPSHELFDVGAHLYACFSATNCILLEAPW